MTTLAADATPLVDASVSTMGEGPISAPMVAALEGAWAAIRARHPQVPAVMMVLGAGSIGAAGGLKLGHFAAMRWADPDQAAAQDGICAGAVRLPEVFVGGEGLVRGPAEVLGTLLHEAAHALAHVRGIKDTSRQGRWHNARFKALAEELGIEVTKDARLGWSPTTIPPGIREIYAEVIADLGRALRLHRSVEITDGGRPKKPSAPPCVCDCGRRIRVSPTVMAAGPITCGVCGTDFTPDRPDHDENGDGEWGEQRFQPGCERMPTCPVAGLHARRHSGAAEARGAVFTSKPIARYVTTTPATSPSGILKSSVLSREGPYDVGGRYLMALDREIEVQRRVLGDLQRVRSSTSAWHDEQRRRLDEQRLIALEQAALQLLSAFSSAQQQIASADRLLQKQDSG